MRTFARLPYCILLTECLRTNSGVIEHALLRQTKSEPTVSGASVNFALEIRASSMLLLLVVGNWKRMLLVSFSFMNLIRNSFKIGSVRQKFQVVGAHAHAHTVTSYEHFFLSFSLSLVKEVRPQPMVHFYLSHHSAVLCTASSKMIEILGFQPRIQS